MKADPSVWRRDLAALALPDDLLWVGSGRSTAHPILGTVTGVKGCFAPPFALPDLKLSIHLEVDGDRIPDHGGPGMGDAGLLYAGGSWSPAAIERSGTYHLQRNGRLVSLSVVSRLVPLYSRAGFVLEVEVRNRAERAVALRVVPLLEPGHPYVLPLNRWAYPKPRPGGEPAEPAGPQTWRVADMAVRLHTESPSASIGPGAIHVCRVAVMADTPTAEAGAIALSNLADETKQRWEARLATHLAAVPGLRGTHAALVEYYHRSLVSGLVCLWDHPDFSLHPHPSTSGLDGGALCSYVWDTGGYAPNLLSAMLGPQARELAAAFARLDLRQCYAMAPDGSPVGVAYAYNVFSFVSLVKAVCVQHGPDAELLEEARRLIDAVEARAGGDLLVDFGGHENLLEMRARGWEHRVASPNAERAWCLRTLAGLDPGNPRAPAWRARADEILRALHQHLWDPAARWFRCLHPEGSAELVYSIQVFDALRAGACTAEMETAVLSHLRNDGFLGTHGVSSVARADELHYELNDPDWSGGGAYIGDPPVLALTLYERGHAGEAWDVLQRLLWMGRHFPYFPQETYADRPAAPAHKRANAISGLAGAEAIIFGLFGLYPQADGSLSIHPHPVPGETLSLTGFRHRGHGVDVTLEPDRIIVVLDGTKVFDGPPGIVRVLKV